MDLEAPPTRPIPPPPPAPPPASEDSAHARRQRVKMAIVRDWFLLKQWLGPPLHAIEGRINWTEFVRIAIVSIMTGGVTGLFQGLVSAVPTLFIDPADAGKVTLILTALTAVFETLRRRRQGKPRTP